MINFSRKFQTAFQSDCTILYIHQKIFHILDNSLILSAFVIVVILVGMKWYLSVVLIWISLVTNDVEYLVLISNLNIIFGERAIQIFGQFQIGLSVLLLLLFIYLFIYLFIFWLHHGMWDLSSLTRDQTRAPYIGSAES